MSLIINHVTVYRYDEDGEINEKKLVAGPGYLQVTDECDNLLVRLRRSPLANASAAAASLGPTAPGMANDGNPKGMVTSAQLATEPILIELAIFKETETAQTGACKYLIANSNDDKSGHVLKFNGGTSDCRQFVQMVRSFKFGRKESVFALRTDDASASQYFQFYGYLSQQQNMMQDYIRTSTYQRAILSNSDDFKDKVVLDVGAGSGILSFFAVQAGAKKVYAVEASSMAKHAEHLVAANKLSHKITVLAGKIEEIVLPEKVDVIISEPMGYMLFNERMLETYLHAKKWFSPHGAQGGPGKMFPSRGDLHVAPFSDAGLYMEQMNKANFWFQESFHGVNLASLRPAAVKEYFRQPIVDTFDIRICVAKSYRHIVDFRTALENDLHKIEVPVNFQILQTGEIHGLAFWFDVAFLGSNQNVWLSTSPTQPLTHWYQVRCLIDTPIFMHRGQTLTGRVVLNSNKRQSYDVEMELFSPDGTRTTNTLDLKNPYFRYTGQAPQPPPGTLETSPSEQYWQQQDMPAQTGSGLNPISGLNNVQPFNGFTTTAVPSVMPAQQQPGTMNNGIVLMNGHSSGQSMEFTLNNPITQMAPMQTAMQSQQIPIQTGMHYQAGLFYSPPSSLAPVSVAPSISSLNTIIGPQADKKD